MFRFCLPVVALFAVGTVAFAQPKPNPAVKAQLEKAVERSLGGKPDTAYVVVLITEKPDKVGGALQAGGALLDIFTLPLRVLTWASGSQPLPWFHKGVNPKSSFTAEVAVFADRKSAAEAIAAFGLTEDDGQLRNWQLLKRSPEVARAVLYGDREEAKFQNMAKANAKLTVTRRPNPPVKK